MHTPTRRGMKLERWCWRVRLEAAASSAHSFPPVVTSWLQRSSSPTSQPTHSRGAVKSRSSLAHPQPSRLQHRTVVTRSYIVVTPVSNHQQSRSACSHRGYNHRASPRVESAGSSAVSNHRGGDHKVRPSVVTCAAEWRQTERKWHGAAPVCPHHDKRQKRLAALAAARSGRLPRVLAVQPPVSQKWSLTACSSPIERRWLQRSPRARRMATGECGRALRAPTRGGVRPGRRAR